MTDMTFHSFPHTFSQKIFFPCYQTQVLTRPVSMWQRKIYLWATICNVYSVVRGKKVLTIEQRKSWIEPHRVCKLHAPKGFKRLLTDSVHFFLSASVFTGLSQTLSMKRWPLINVFETSKWHQVLALYLGKLRTILFINNEVNSAFNLYFTSPLLYLRLLCQKGLLKFLKNLSFADFSHKIAALKSHITTSSQSFWR